ncbi:MAG: nicotinate phosphoribosyltransferase [Candidatus Cloacimonetes bacterium 4572_55]|nr:MAG: nicotinate phosphoribosyltransferase [Candidatus Cloacimonetes bacterium 4572_55]
MPPSNYDTLSATGAKFNRLLYNQSLALLTDLYQITMAYGYWKTGMSERESVFHLFFRKNPFKGGFSVACGLETVIDYLDHFQFAQSDLEYLATLTGNDTRKLFDDGFLNYLKKLCFACDIDAIPEGAVVFPHEPLIRVQGPLIQCQLLETALLNMINFQTLIATKAARVCIATQSQPVLEFGLRRAQGIDGGITAARAAYIGGCSSTSNVLAGKIYDIPVRGTHAHSWVLCFDREIDSFRAYADVMPNNCVFLVDTYHTLEGVKNAIVVGRELREQGFEMVGIRLDSGDLAYLSIEARKLLDHAGFPDAKIVASNDLDEQLAESLKNQGAKIDLWGIGTKLITAYEQPALGGVYKLSAIRSSETEWHQKVKLSEQYIKVSNPGIQQVRRYYDESENIADVIYDVHTDLSQGCVMVDQLNMTRRKSIPKDTKWTDLLVPIYRKGKRVYDSPSIHEIRGHTSTNLCRFHSGIKRFHNPHQYPVGIEKSLFDMKTELILKARRLEK